MIAMWLERAEGGDPSAQYQLGWCHENGEGVERDLESAFRWYRRAARQGHPRAQYHYGLACSTGVPGVPWNRVEAFKWLTLAAKAGLREAVAALEIFRLPAEEREQGAAAAREFLASPEPQTSPSPSHQAPATTAPPTQTSQLSLPL